MKTKSYFFNSFNTWFCSDHHFYHKNIIKYCNRPFKDVAEMNAALIAAHNKKVKPTDNVFFLGDFGMGSFEQLNEVFTQLNGNKFLIIGNHDLQNSAVLRLDWQSVDVIKEIKVQVNLTEQYPWSQHIVMCHYAMRVWPKSHHNSLMLYGHSHGTLPAIANSLDVGVDYWNYAPCSLVDVLKANAVFNVANKPNE